MILPTAVQAPQRSRAEIATDYRRVLFERLLAQRNYPEAARLQHYQGEGAVMFHIDRDGRLLAASMEKSTGKRILDRAALTQVRRAAPFPEIPSELPDERMLKERLLPEMPGPIRDYFEQERPIELRHADPMRYVDGKPRGLGQNVWLRATGPLPDDAAVHQCVLAYASDMTLLDSSLAPHGSSVFSSEIQAASLDHSLWFHRPFRADQWLLYVQDTPFAGGARALTRGRIYTEAGELVASVAQEGLIRRRVKS